MLISGCRIISLGSFEMATVLPSGRAPASRALAQEITVAQKKEIAGIDAWLAKRGQ